ncbi:aconitate hydratase 1 [Nitrosococcus oceani AFC27]|nr:aconitate hydratase 1 [Nitrosococcus oceani AFC27]
MLWHFFIFRRGLLSTFEGSFRQGETPAVFVQNYRKQHWHQARRQIMTNDPFGITATLKTASGAASYVSLTKLADKTGADVARLPHTVKILLENIARRVGSRDVSQADVEGLAHWPNGAAASLAFMPARVLMQDFTGVPAVVDLAAMRSAMARAGGDPKRVNPLVPVDLVIDHSVQVDRFGSADAYAANLEWEYRRNRERYALLNWAQQAFDGFRVVPPGMGICHQVNLEHLGRVVIARDGWVFPDTLVGMDSHTPMINGLGVLGWGVGGIEAEAAMLGQPMFLPKPIVLGVRMRGALPPGTTATDLVLTLAQMLRAYGVVGKFVEFFGSGLSSLGIADRATLSNMSPEFGATATLFPVDFNTLEYLRLTGRGANVDLVERYTREQGLFRTDNDVEPNFSEVLDFDLSKVEPSVAGPKRPQDRVALADVRQSFKSVIEGVKTEVSAKAIARLIAEGGPPEEGRTCEGPAEHLHQPNAAASVTHGSVVIAAITSCTNTSNPSVMIAAGLLARKAVESGLQSRPWVKTSLAPGSRVVTDYLNKAGLMPYLEKLGFNLVGYGCTTCIGNSGPLPEEVAKAVTDKDLAVAAVLSGNRNYEGRIHAQVKASYLASPPLVVAYALVGTVLCDLSKDPLGKDGNGKPIYLKDIWPSAEEVEAMIASSVSADQFDKEYGRIFEGDEKWKSMPAPTGTLFDWSGESTYVREPPFFIDFADTPTPVTDIEEARALAVLGDSITTDHISPAGAISDDSPAGQYLLEHGVPPAEFNSFGSRRGNHEVMMRGTFGNIRLRNAMVPGAEGPWTVHVPSGEKMSIYDAAVRYEQEGTPLVVIAGREYGSGSSRDWAAKGAALLGVKAVIAESYERIHRSNLVCMGVLPLQFKDGDSAKSLGLTGFETFSIAGIGDGIEPRQSAKVSVTRQDGSQVAFDTTVRIDAPAEIEYFLNGGILQMVLRQLLAA